MEYQWVLACVASCALPHLGGILVRTITARRMATWYKDLKKPFFHPPSWILGPTWAAMYTAMGLAAYLVWANGNGWQGEAKLPLTLYGIQLVLNWAWTPIFFGLKRPDLALLEILLLLACVGACVVTFQPVSVTASYLMIPYLGWIGFASLLNYCMWKMNRSEKQQ